MFDCLKKLFDDVEIGNYACNLQCSINCENKVKEILTIIEDK